MALTISQREEVHDSFNNNNNNNILFYFLPLSKAYRPLPLLLLLSPPLFQGYPIRSRGINTWLFGGGQLFQKEKFENQKIHPISFVAEIMTSSLL